MRQYSPNGFSRSRYVNGVMEKLLKRAGATITALGLLIIGALIAGCGSGGGSGDGAGVSPQVVSGVAATGAPLAGQVTLRDSSSVRKDKVTIIGSDGSFAVDVADMTAPFILKATGTADGVSGTMFSFADKPGIANINPLSTVAVASAAGVDDPATVFDKPDSATLDKVKSAMPGSVATLQSKLKPLLDVFSVSTTNPVKDPFTADHDGLDGVFDNVKVVLSNGTLTITNVNTGAVIFTAQVKDVESGRFTDNNDDLPKPGPRPVAPTGVTAVGGDAQVTISWDPVANATSYDLIYATRSKVAEEEDHNDVDAKQVKNVTSPFVVTGLAASTTYFVIVRARNDGRRGPASAEVSATTSATTPAPTIPTAPIGVTATGGTKQVTISWAAVSGATSYNLYWSTTTGVTTTNGTKISDVTSPPAVHTGLTDSTPYFYVVTAVNSAGESAASVEVAATTLAVTSPTTTTAGPTTTTTAGPGPTTTTAGPGPTTTTAPTTTTTTKPTTTTTASTTTTTLAPPNLAPPNGAALYTQNCSGCHGALATSAKRGRTAAQITDAIASNRGGMGTINLTPEQIAAVSAALL